MTKRNAQKALKHIEKIQQLMSKVHSPYAGLTKQQAIDKMRKIRTKLWEEKFAPRS